MRLVPESPIYIPSKSRADIATTPRALDRMHVPYRLVVEEQQAEMYGSFFPPDRLLILDPLYVKNYDPLGDFEGKSLGSGPARNFIWDHAIAEDAGTGWHWCMDDNIRVFARLHQNVRTMVADGSTLYAMEDFVNRYRNIAMAGPNYWMFANSRATMPPFVLNTRVYSCNLIRNDIPFRWRGRYNEDTILCLDILKAGWVTVLFNAFLQWKFTTQTMPGGNTEAFYGEEGTLPKSKMLVEQHPDVARLAWRWERWHHYVDYSGFKKNRLIRRADYVPPEDNPYHLKLISTPGYGYWSGPKKGADR